MAGTMGFRILARTRKVAPEVVEAFRGIPVANVSDCMSRMSAGGARLRAMHGGAHLAGPALTVRCRPGDNLMVHKALELAQAGDVIVVDAGGDLTNALFGEIMMAIAIARGVSGIVINGAVRDAAEIAASPFPVYAAGVTHRGPYKDGPGEINVPIAIDGMVVTPGDLVLGDVDGVLCVPFDFASDILQAARNKMRAEKETLAQIASGRYDPGWIDASLKRLGCEFPS
jgi:RraA family protein